MNYKFVIIGAKDTTITMAKYVMAHVRKPDCIITVDESSVNTKNISGYASVEQFARDNGIEIFKVKDYSMKDEESRMFFESNTFELGVSMGWQRLIPKYVLDRFSVGIFGFHGSCGYLPYGKGRSPLNWSIIKGDERFILNCFKYDEKADSPNVFAKRMFQINEFDTIRTLQYKNLLCSYEMVSELVKCAEAGNVNINRESKDYEFFYEKRTPKDGKIDFKGRTRDIYNLVRGVTKPFPGAYVYVNGDEEQVVNIWSLVPFDSIMDFSAYEVGEVIEVLDGLPIVRTLDGSVLIREYDSAEELKVGDVLQ
ncbi:MAG: hypothetical protein IJB96_11715 [Lachnospira sp.]|nr:hypothetical protein [Lachnospira sp.]